MHGEPLELAGHLRPLVPSKQIPRPYDWLSMAEHEHLLLGLGTINLSILLGPQGAAISFTRTTCVPGSNASTDACVLYTIDCSM